MAILIDDLMYPQVRAAIDISLTEKMLPDEVIAMDQFAGAAERQVRRLDPSADTRTEAELTRLRTAVVLYTAAFLVPSIPDITLEQVGGAFRYEREKTDLDKKIANLLSRAAAEVDAVLYPSEDALGMPTMFTYAPGDRGVIF